jgi:methionyl aminopeptidase
MAEGGRILGAIRDELAAYVRPGISTGTLDEIAEGEILKKGGRPSFKGYGHSDNRFPASICASINDVVVHGIPSKTMILEEGDIISIDIGMIYKGFHTDTAVTVAVGKISDLKHKLMDVTKLSLMNAIEFARSGMRVGDISAAIQTTVEDAGFSVVRDLVGHGVGRSLHEEPSIPCFGKPGTGPILKEGMVVAIEPMVNAGGWQLTTDADGWTMRTRDNSPSAHFEHTVAITASGPVVLTGNTLGVI